MSSLTCGVLIYDNYSKRECFSYPSSKGHIFTVAGHDTHVAYLSQDACLQLNQLQKLPEDLWIERKVADSLQ